MAATSQQAGKGSVGRGQRDLLFEDDVDERGEAGFTRPEWWWAIAVDDPRQIGIKLRQGFDALQQRCLIKLIGG